MSGVHISLRIDGLDDVLADFDRFGAEAHEAAEDIGEALAAILERG